VQAQLITAYIEPNIKRLIKVGRYTKSISIPLFCSVEVMGKVYSGAETMKVYGHVYCGLVVNIMICYVSGGIPLRRENLT
jgi:hypothetical protein